MARQVGNRWLADVEIDGRRRRLKFKTQKEAEAFENQPKVMASRLEDPTVGEVFRVWGEDMWNGTRNERSALLITDKLIEELGPNKRVKAITREDIAKLRSRWETKGNAPRTINTKLAALSKLLTYAVEEAQIMDSRPKTKFNKVRKGRIRALSSNEEGAILGGMEEPFRMLGQFLLYTGCRVSEALNMTWKDVDWDEEDGSVTFWDTKNGDERSVPLVAKSREALLYGKAKGWATPFKGIYYNTFIKVWRKAKKGAGLSDDKQVVPHVLRHTCATRLGKSNVDPLRLQAWMGHSSLEMTRRYTHLGVGDLKDAAKALEKRR